MKKIAPLLLALLSSCSILPEGGIAPKKITLSPNLPIQKNKPAIQRGITLLRPTTSGDLDSQNIRYVEHHYITSPVGGMVWSDQLPDLVERQLQRAFDRDGSFKFQTENSAVLHTTIVAFDIVSTHQTPTITITFAMKWVDQPTGRVLASQEFHNTTPLHDLSGVSFARLVNQSFEHLLSQIVAWSKTALR